MSALLFGQLQKCSYADLFLLCVFVLCINYVLLNRELRVESIELKANQTEIIRIRGNATLVSNVGNTLHMVLSGGDKDTEFVRVDNENSFAHENTNW